MVRSIEQKKTQSKVNKISDPFCYFNGKIISRSKISIDPMDLGFLRSYGVFDFLRTCEGKPLFLKEHLKRLRNSAKLFNIKLLVNEAEFEKIIQELLRKNRFKDSNIKIVVTGGVSEDGITYLGKTTVLVLVEEHKDLPFSLYEKGVKLITLEHQRGFFAAKHLDYSAAVTAQSTLKKEKAFRVLYVSGGKFLECSTANIFFIKGNSLITPINNILLGATRNFVLGIACNKFKIEERDVLIEELDSMDEVFITASNIDIMPVVKVNSATIGNGKVGPQTKILMDLFKESIDFLNK